MSTGWVKNIGAMHKKIPDTMIPGLAIKNERKEEDTVFDAIQLSARQTHLLILSSLQLTVVFMLVDLPQCNPVVSITCNIVSAQIPLSRMSCLLPSTYKYNSN